MWLSAAHDRSEGEDEVGHAEVTKKAAMWKAGVRSVDDSNWVIPLVPVGDSRLMLGSVHCSAEDAGGEYADGKYVSTRKGVMGFER
jgi:hypothetical protein